MLCIECIYRASHAAQKLNQTSQQLHKKLRTTFNSYGISVLRPIQIAQHFLEKKFLVWKVISAWIELTKVYLEWIQRPSLLYPLFSFVAKTSLWGVHCRFQA